MLATGLVLGGGVASAETCTSVDGVQYTGPASAITDGVCNADDILSGTLSPLDTTPSTPTTTEAPPPSTTTDDPKPSAPVVTVPSVAVPPVVVPPVLPPLVPGSMQPGTTQPAGTPPPPAGSTQTQTAAAGGAASSPAAAVVTAPALGVLPVSGTVLDSLFTAPAAFSPVALSAPYNPGLLLSAPLGSPLRALATGDPASAVTTASQVQAMALDGLPQGVGIPAVIGVLILSGLGGLALRRRLLSRPAGPTTPSS